MESKGSVNGDEEEDQELDTDQPTTLPILRVAGHEGTKQQRREKQRENKDKVNGKFSCEKVDNCVDEESFILYINMSRFLPKYCVIKKNFKSSFPSRKWTNIDHINHLLYSFTIFLTSMI